MSVCSHERLSDEEECEIKPEPRKMEESQNSSQEERRELLEPRMAYLQPQPKVE
jgi:hypothetical protein